MFIYIYMYIYIYIYIFLYIYICIHIYVYICIYIYIYTGFLQCFIMPSVLSNKTLPKVLSAIPIIIFTIIIGGYIYPSLLTIMLGFGALKVLEYSIMTSATEMIYMPMNHQERYLGKELIRFFGHRMGKSVAVMILSAASAHFNPSMATQVRENRPIIFHVRLNFLSIF
jgi:ATP/ADP translocase